MMLMMVTMVMWMAHKSLLSHDGKVTHNATKRYCEELTAAKNIRVPLIHLARALPLGAPSQKIAATARKVEDPDLSMNVLMTELTMVTINTAVVKFRMIAFFAEHDNQSIRLYIHFPNLASLFGCVRTAHKATTP